MSIKSQYAEAIRTWRASFWKFAVILMIVDRDSDIDQEVKLLSLASAVRNVQKKVLDDVLAHRWAYLLKARRMGISTIIAAWFFWKCLFTPGLKVAVVAHTHEAAEEIFAIYKRFYDNLPGWLRTLFTADTESVREIKFFHEGRIKVFSARSESARGGGWHLIHASEVSKWPSLIKAVKSIFQTADGNARVILETTAEEGLNEAYELWNGTGKFKRAADFFKRFYPWFDDDDYRLYDYDSDYQPLPSKKEDLEWELEYQETYNLDAAQMAWLRVTLSKKCFGSYETLNQEYPPTAELAWIVGGTPYFNRHLSVPDIEIVDGIQVFAEPIPYRTYLMGVDTAAGGPDGDRSSFCIVDPNPAERMKHVVATFRGRLDVHEHAIQAYEWAVKYHAFTTIEMNFSPDVGQYFKAKGYPHLYVRRYYDKAGDEYGAKLGYQTTPYTRPTLLHRLQADINLDRIAIPCLRLRQEVNAFQYDKNGRPDHPPGGFDDLLIACALALEGEDQAGEAYEQDVVYARRPRDPLEAAMWEIANPGLLYDESMGFADDNEWGRQIRALIAPGGIPLT